MQRRRIIGIDPGLASTGFGIVDSLNGRMNLVSYGVIETRASEDHSVRLLAIYNRFLSVLEEFRPDEAEMETLYFSRNVTSALAVAEAKGVISLCLAQRGVPLSFYTPNKIKTTVTGSASADKKTVERAVKILLNLRTEPKPDHAADALAGAITHIHSAAWPTI
ncbi:MAG: crossover junction endodeoxyribonuclease RuvC [Treponema sp.]|nr:crossover junction endodeoxyribonuclease RuvC [Treponema sp.]